MKTYTLQRNINNGIKDIKMKDTLDNTKLELENIQCKINFNETEIIINISSLNKNSTEEEKTFEILYDFIFIIYGFYPPIVGKHNNELAEKYNTASNYIKNDNNFINKLSNVEFKESFIEFKNIYDKFNFAISYFAYSVSQVAKHYPEIIVVILLQVLDGIYDDLKITKDDRYIIKDIEKLKQLKEKIKNLEVDNIFDDKEKKKVKEKLREIPCRLENVNYNSKLEFIFNYVDEEYKIFNFEKNNKKYNELITKCKHTRNKYSHSSECNKCLNGEESAIYAYKFIMIIRLLILEEIGLKDKIDFENIKKLNNSINKMLLNKEDI